MKKKTSILRIAMSLHPLSSAYNQLTLPMIEKQDITYCSFNDAQLTPDQRLTCFVGNGRVLPFMQRLRMVLRSRTFDVIDLDSPHLGIFFLVAALSIRPHMLRRSVLRVRSSFHNYRFRNKLFYFVGFLFAGRVVCCSHASLDSLPWIYRQLAGKRLVVIQNCADLHRINSVRDEVRTSSNNNDEDDNVLRIATVGRLVTVKDQITIIKGFAEANLLNASLTIIGEGELRERLEQEIDECGVRDRVQLTGQLSRNDTLKHLLTADLFVAMSYHEGLPVAVLEALACECPTVLSDIPAHREVSDGLGNVCLVACEDVGALARAIERIANMHPVELAAWGAQCRRHVERHFSLDRQLESFIRVFEEMIAGSQEIKMPC